MGSIATLFFSGYPVNDTKNHLDQWIFKESDKRVYTRKISERDDITWGVHEGEDDTETAYTFEATVETAIKRLELRGYTLEACKNDFEHRVREEILKLSKLVEHDAEFVSNQRRIYSKYGSFDRWINAFQLIVEDRPKPVYYFSEPEKVHEDELVNYMLNPPSVWNEDWHPCGFEYPSLDFNFFARTFLEACDRKSTVQLDATDLVQGGWYEGFEHLKDIVKPNTRFHGVFSESINEVLKLVSEGNNLCNRSLLAKVLYANVISALETYLSDTLVYTVISFPPLIRRVIESDPEFKKRKLELSDLFRRHDGIKSEVSKYLEGLMYHDLAKINELYKSTLCVDFPKDMGDIFRAVDIRHDIVHRNGRRRTGENVDLSLESVKELTSKMKSFVESIDLQVKNVYPTVLEGEF